MRLLSTKTLHLTEFVGEIPYYAILSHRWEDEEVLFEDIRTPPEYGRKMKGYRKIEGCINQAKMDGWEWVWIDSCCIDKSSSAELSEAINSMFRWYRDAQVCYAYLSDVLWEANQDNLHHECSRSGFMKSKWWSRGWTLQELLAPETVIFYDCKWRDLGTKYSLKPIIKEITRISDMTNFDDASVAQKLSWASHRKTTRVEDMAYSLMGIFKINMPLLYGEGKKAFLRLQVEILNKIGDESIFAWTDNISSAPGGGLLATGPEDFRYSGNIRSTDWDSIKNLQHFHKAPIAFTNMGLRIDNPIVYFPNEGVYGIPLRCARKGSKEPVLVRLEKTTHNTFERALHSKIYTLHFSEEFNVMAPRSIYIRQVYQDGPSMSYIYPPWGSISQKYTLRLEGLKKNGLSVSDIFGGKIISQPLQKLSLCQIRHKIDDAKTDPERDGLSLNWTNARGQGRTDDFLVVILNHRDKALCFAVFVEKVESRLYVDIYRHEEGNVVFLADAVPREFTIDSTTSRDRLSTHLGGGRSVTVVAKKEPEIRDSGQCKNRNHYNIIYKIYISIDDTGYLPFPRLEKSR